MIDAILILIALMLFPLSAKKYRSISYTVLCWLVISDITYNYFFLEFRVFNNWIIYWIYSVINLYILIMLDLLKSHQAMKVLISANILLNIATSYYFISSLDLKSVYNSYYFIASSIAILSIIYMGFLSYGVRYLDSDDNNRNFISHFLCSRYSIIFGRD